MRSDDGKTTRPAAKGANPFGDVQVAKSSAQDIAAAAVSAGHFSPVSQPTSVDGKKQKKQFQKQQEQQLDLARKSQKQQKRLEKELEREKRQEEIEKQKQKETAERLEYEYEVAKKPV